MNTSPGGEGRVGRLKAPVAVVVVEDLTDVGHQRVRTASPEHNAPGRHLRKAGPLLFHRSRADEVDGGQNGISQATRMNPLRQKVGYAGFSGTE